MALALGMVGQPVQPYLTSGSTDFVDSVLTGQQAGIANKKSALDLLTAQQNNEAKTRISGKLPQLIEAANKGKMTAQEQAEFSQGMPELADKYIKTNDAKVKENVSNFLGSSLLKLTHSTDKAADQAAILEAANNYGINLNVSPNATPEELQNALNVAFRGVKAFDDKTDTIDAEGNVVSQDLLGNKSIKPSTNKPKAVPVVENGKEKTRPISLPNGRTRTERLMSDGTWQELDTSAPPTQKSAGAKYSDPVFDPVMGAYTQKDLSTGQVHVLDKGYEQGAPIVGESPRKQAGALVQQRAQAITIPAGQAIADISNIVSLSPDVKFSISQDVVGKGGTLTSGVRNFLARTSTDEENRQYETAFKGLNNAVARLSNAGYTFSKAQADAYDEAMRFTDKDTNKTKVYALLTGIQHVREALKSSKMGTPEQRALIKDYIHELEGYPTPKEFIATTGASNKSIGGMIPKNDEQAKGGKSDYDLYVQHWKNANGNPALQGKLTERARQMGIVK